MPSQTEPVWLKGGKAVGKWAAEKYAGKIMETAGEKTAKLREKKDVTPIEVTNQVKMEVCNGKMQVEEINVKINAKEVAIVVMVGVVAGKVVSFLFKKLFGGGGGAPPAPAPAPAAN